MAPMLLRHVTSRARRESIADTGLEVRRPADNNWPTFTAQPPGVYVTDASQRPWFAGDDLYEFTYIGPMMNDPEIGRGHYVLLEPVPPDQLTLKDASDYRGY